MDWCACLQQRLLHTRMTSGGAPVSFPAPPLDTRGGRERTDGWTDGFTDGLTPREEQSRFLDNRDLVMSSLHTMAPHLAAPHRTAPPPPPHRTLPDLDLPCRALPYLTLPCLTQPNHALPHLTLPYHTLPDPTLPCLTLSYVTLRYVTFRHLTLLYPTSSHLTKTAPKPHHNSPKTVPKQPAPNPIRAKRYRNIKHGVRIVETQIPLLLLLLLLPRTHFLAHYFVTG